MKIKVLGIDPSMQNFGIAVSWLDLDSLALTIEDLILLETATDKAGKKVVRKNSDDLRRARVLQSGMIKACAGVSMAFVEIPVGSQSARAMASYGMCIGVLASCPVPLIEVTPYEVKEAAVGDKTAAKEEMIEWATKLYPGAPWRVGKVKGKAKLLNSNEHLADAVAAIEAGKQTEQFRHAVSMYKAIAA